MFSKTISDPDTAAVYERNAARVYRICYLRLRSAADAEDAVQNVFLRWLKNPRKFRDTEHEKAYFIVCAQNESKNAAKNYWRTHRTSMEEIADPVSAETAEGETEMTELLFALPPQYRQTLYLYYFEGYSTKEIARLTGRAEDQFFFLGRDIAVGKYADGFAVMQRLDDRIHKNTLLVRKFSFIIEDSRKKCNKKLQNEIVSKVEFCKVIV